MKQVNKNKEIFDESGNIFGLDFIIKKTSKRECLLCKTNLDKEIGEGKWHIPLCKKHRLEELEKQNKKITISNTGGVRKGMSSSAIRIKDFIKNGNKELK